MEACEALVESLLGGSGPKLYRTLVLYSEGQRQGEEGHSDGGFICAGGAEGGGGRPRARPVEKGDKKRGMAHSRTQLTEWHGAVTEGFLRQYPI